MILSEHVRLHYLLTFSYIYMYLLRTMQNYKGLIIISSPWRRGNVCPKRLIFPWNHPNGFEGS